MLPGLFVSYALSWSAMVPVLTWSPIYLPICMPSIVSCVSLWSSMSLWSPIPCSSLMFIFGLLCLPTLHVLMPSPLYICLVSHAFLVSCVSLAGMSPCICLVLISCAYLVSYMFTYVSCVHLCLVTPCRSPLKQHCLHIKNQ